MFADFLLVLGCTVVSIALRGSGKPVLMRLGNLGVLFTSYLLGLSLTGLPLVGALCASSWLLFPWIDIVTRVRHIQMPTNRPLKSQAPPGASRFPALGELTDEIEAEGFVHVEDAGWDHEEQRQYVRLFVHSTKNVRATVNLVENEQISFFYLTVSSRTSDGILWCTWNYPFSSSLKPAPNWRLQRFRNAEGFWEMFESHQSWLTQSKAPPVSPLSSDPEQLLGEIEQELEGQVTHNIRCGLLVQADEGQVKYSWRGCFFLWTQFLRDLLVA